jgi:putative ABC transport system permease protein
VVGWEVWHRLFGDNTPVAGQRLRFERHQCVVVGVLKSKPIMGGGGDETWMWNRKILLPETTFDAMITPDHGVSTIYVRLGTSPSLTKKMKLVEELLGQLLLRTHGAPNFKVKAQNDSEGQQQLILGIIKGLLLSTALLSLLVGGINIMNIMLVTVTERTREIGVRRALGATPRAISLQFLLEATFIGGVGGLIGVAGGIGLTWLIAFALAHSTGGTFVFHVETWAVTLGLSLSMSTGAAFGLFPAVKASRLDPVEALRFE